MDVFDRAIRHQQPMLVVEILSAAGCTFDRLLDASPILRMSAIKDVFKGDRTRLVISKDPEEFLGADAFVSNDIPDEAAGLAHSLCFDQFGFASP